MANLDALRYSDAVPHHDAVPYCDAVRYHNSILYHHIVPHHYAIQYQDVSGQYGLLCTSLTNCQRWNPTSTPPTSFALIQLQVQLQLLQLHTLVQLAAIPRIPLSDSLYSTLHRYRVTVF